MGFFLQKAHMSMNLKTCQEGSYIKLIPSYSLALEYILYNFEDCIISFSQKYSVCYASVHLRRLKTPITPKTPAARLYSIYSVHHLGNSEPFQLGSQTVCIFATFKIFWICKHLSYIPFYLRYSLHPEGYQSMTNFGNVFFPHYNRNYPE